MSLKDVPAGTTNAFLGAGPAAVLSLWRIKIGSTLNDSGKMNRRDSSVIVKAYVISMTSSWEVRTDGYQSRFLSFHSKKHEDYLYTVKSEGPIFRHYDASLARFKRLEAMVEIHPRGAIDDRSRGSIDQRLW